MPTASSAARGCPACVAAAHRYLQQGGPSQGGPSQALTVHHQGALRYPHAACSLTSMHPVGHNQLPTSLHPGASHHTGTAPCSPDHLHLLAGEAALLIEGHVLLAAVQDHLVAARLLHQDSRGVPWSPAAGPRRQKRRLCDSSAAGTLQCIGFHHCCTPALPRCAPLPRP